MLWVVLKWVYCWLGWDWIVPGNWFFLTGGWSLCFRVVLGFVWFWLAREKMHEPEGGAWWHLALGTVLKPPFRFWAAPSQQHKEVFSKVLFEKQGEMQLCLRSLDKCEQSGLLQLHMQTDDCRWLCRGDLLGYLFISSGTFLPYPGTEFTVCSQWKL